MIHKHQERVLLLPTNESCIHYYIFGLIKDELGVFEIQVFVMQLDIRILPFYGV